MIFLYGIALYCLLPFLLIKLLLRALKNPRYFQHIPQRFGYKLPPTAAPQRRGIWIHAVSVGEVNAALPIVRYLTHHQSSLPITVTTMTPTGSDRVKKIMGDSVSHCYLPYDYPGAVKRFLNQIQPKLAIVMETEIWPNYIMACAARNILTLYANVRLSERSHKRYKRIQTLITPTLQAVTQFAVQSQKDADRLIDLGALKSRIVVTGNIKFELEVAASTLEAAQSVRRDLGWDRPIWLVGSTHENEESHILDAYRIAVKQYDDLLLVMAPRHPQRFQSVHKLCIKRGYTTQLRSRQRQAVTADIEIVVADTMGELMLLIAAADFSFIGGSMVKIGGHNILEACSVGKAVIFGRYMFNFAEIAELVLAQGAGIQVKDSKGLAEAVIKLIGDPILRDQYGMQGKQLYEDNKGALTAIANLITDLLRA